jgi:hypothetical protein
MIATQKSRIHSAGIRKVIVVKNMACSAQSKEVDATDGKDRYPSRSFHPPNLALNPTKTHVTTPTVVSIVKVKVAMLSMYDMLLVMPTSVLKPLALTGTMSAATRAAGIMLD